MEQELGFSSIVATDIVERFIEQAQRTGSEVNSAVEFRTALATALPFEDGAFSQIVCLGVVLSHLPHRRQRIQALQECHRALKVGGVLVLNTMNILRRAWYIPILKLAVGIRRAISNPHGYERTSLPRVGTGGRFDPCFLRKDKPTLHYYSPGELVFDLASCGIHVVKLLTAGDSLDGLENEAFREDGYNIYVVGRKASASRSSASQVAIRGRRLPVR